MVMSFLAKRFSNLSNKQTFRSGIIIHLCHDNLKGFSKRPEEIKVAEYGRSYTSEELCELASSKLALTWLVFPMMGVARKVDDVFEWVGVEEKVECKKDSLEHLYFRFRLMPSYRGMRIMKGSGKCDFEYFMLQVREDYLASRFFKPKEADTPFILGLAISDKLRFMKAYEVELEQASKVSFLHFIPPKVLKEHFNNFLTRKDLLAQLDTKLHEYCQKNASVEERELMYTITHEIIKKITDYAVQKIEFEKPPTTVTIQPYHSELPGILIHSLNERYYTKINDVTDATLTHAGNQVIMLHRKGGSPLKVAYSERWKALLLLWFLDGYHRLSEDFNASLCVDVEGAFARMLKQNHLYGPVSIEWAKKRLREKNQVDSNRNYLVKLSRSRPFGLRLFYIKVDQIGSLEISFDPVSRRYSLVQSEGEDGGTSSSDDDDEEQGDKDDDGDDDDDDDVTIDGDNDSLKKVVADDRVDNVKCDYKNNDYSPPINNNISNINNNINNINNNISNNNVNNNANKMNNIDNNDENLDFSLGFNNLNFNDSANSSRYRCKNNDDNNNAIFGAFVNNQNNNKINNHSTNKVENGIWKKKVSCKTNNNNNININNIHNGQNGNKNIHNINGHNVNNNHNKGWFMNIHALVDYHRSKHQLKQCVKPSLPYESRVYLCQSGTEDRRGASTLVGSRDTGVAGLHHQLDNLEFIVSGTYTDVYKTTLEDAGHRSTWAVKRLKPQHEHLLKYFLNLMHDCTSWGRCSFLVKIRSVCLSFPPSIIMEYSPLGSLRSFLQNSSTLPPSKQLISFAESIAQALLFLHDQQDTFHGNVNACNVLLFQVKETLLAKLADPGMTRYYDTSLLEDRIAWLAPEVRERDRRGSKEADVFAYASTLWQLYNHGYDPDKSEMYKLLTSSSYRLPRPSSCHEHIYELMVSCWRDEEHLRPDARDLVRNVRNFLSSGGGAYNDYNDGVTNKVVNVKPMRNLIGQRTTSMSGGGVVMTNHVDSCNSSTLLIGQSGESSLSANHDTTFDTTYDSHFTPLDFSLDFCENSDTIGMNCLDFNSLHPLGEGHYGKVYKGTYQRTDGAILDVAVKCLKKRMYDKYAKEFEKEYMIMKELQHPNVVCVIGRCTDHPESPQILVLEYMKEGCLKLYLSRLKASLGLKDLLTFGHEIAVGMEFLSSRDIVHRDLAARNVLVSADKHAKIADFGLARALSKDRNYYCSDPNKELPAPWCAPESLSHSRFTELTDVWSYGVTLWEVFTHGSPPIFCDLKALWAELHGGKRLNKTDDFPRKVYDFICTHCWSFDPEGRSCFRDIVCHYEHLRKHVLN